MADAMHVQRETARHLWKTRPAYYLFTVVKDNQPGVFAALDALDWGHAPSPAPAATPATAGMRPASCRSCPLPVASPAPARRPARCARSGARSRSGLGHAGTHIGLGKTGQGGSLG